MSSELQKQEATASIDVLCPEQKDTPVHLFFGSSVLQENKETAVFSPDQDRGDAQTPPTQTSKSKSPRWSLFKDRAKSFMGMKKQQAKGTTIQSVPCVEPKKENPPVFLDRGDAQTPPTQNSESKSPRWKLFKGRARSSDLQDDSSSSSSSSEDPKSEQYSILPVQCNNAPRFSWRSALPWLRWKILSRFRPAVTLWDKTFLFLWLVLLALGVSTFILVLFL